MRLPDPPDPMDDIDPIWYDPDGIVNGVPVRDWTALVDYLTGEDTPEAHACTALRLNTDAAFAEFAAPIIMAWTIIPAAHKYDRDAGWAIIQRKAAARIAARSKLQ